MFEVTAPGSIFFIGEHAVLHGKPAIVVAINKIVRVQIRPSSAGRYITIASKNYSDAKVLSEDLESYINHKLSFVFSAIWAFKNEFNLDCDGLDFNIVSEIDPNTGFGSSAAVVVAITKALSQYYNIDINDDDLFALCRRAVLKVQGGLGSGGDIAASICGGMVSIQDGKFEKINCSMPNFSLVYCGYKTKTDKVIKKVNKRAEVFHELYNLNYHKMGEVVALTRCALEQGDINKLGELFAMYQSCLEFMHVSDNTIKDIIRSFERAGYVGAKISGSGLGDCVIGISNQAPSDFPTPAGTTIQAGITSQEVGVDVIEQEAIC